MVDWSLVLEFVKALAAPSAGVCAVILAGRIAVRGFRKQKLIERRLDWYESMLQNLVNATRAISLAAFAGPDSEPARAVHDAVEGLMLVSIKANLYADKAGYEAVLSLIPQLSEYAPVTRERADAFERVCAQAMATIADEMRRDLSLGRLRSLTTGLPAHLHVGNTEAGDGISSPQ